MLLGRILDRFPRAIDAFLAPGQDSSAVTAAAGSRHLTDARLARIAGGLNPDGTSALSGVALSDHRYALLALVNNPVVLDEVIDEVVAAHSSVSDVAEAVANRRAQGRLNVTETYSKVSDPATLNWLLRRARPSDYKPRGRVGDLAELAINPALSEHDRTDAFAVLSCTMAREELGPRYASFWKVLVERFPAAAEYLPTELGGADAAEHDPPRAPQWARDVLFGDDDREAVTITERQRTSASDLRLTSLYYATEGEFAAAGEILAELLGADTSLWENMLMLSDEFEGTLTDLAMVASAV